MTLNPTLQGSCRSQASIGLFWFHLKDPNREFHSCALFQEAGTGRAGEAVFHHRFHKTAIQL